MSSIYFIDQKSHETYQIQDQALIGSSSSCQFDLGSQFLSPEHLSITSKNENYFVESLESKNQVFLNGVKILSGQKYLLKKGDTLEFARKSFIISNSDELPEKTVSKIRDDVFGLEEPPDAAGLDDLKLDTEYGEAPIDEMKKSRRVIVEIQQTKKQLSVKMQERKVVEDEIEYVQKEAKRIEEELKNAAETKKESFTQRLENELAQINSLEDQISELKAKLSDLMSERDQKQSFLRSQEKYIHLFEEQDKLRLKQANLDSELNTLNKLELEKRIHQLDECLKEEQENYQRLHDIKTLSRPSGKKRFG